MIPFQCRHTLKYKHYLKKKKSSGMRNFRKSEQSGFVHEFEFYGETKKSVVPNVPPDIA